MVAAEDQLFHIEADFGRDRLDEAAEIGRLHARIAALVVDLVAGRLDQHGRAGFHAFAQRRADHGGMGRADGGDAADTAGLVVAGKLAEKAHRASPTGVVAMKASSSAKLEVPSIGPFTVTVRAPAALA